MWSLLSDKQYQAQLYERHLRKFDVDRKLREFTNYIWNEIMIP